MPYRCESASLAAFIQQLAVGYIARGYRFYKTGRVPMDKDPTAVDRKLIARYELDISEWTRARRKRAGSASVQYLRHDRFFVLIATQGTHSFFELESEIKDIRRVPLVYEGYSISYRQSSVTGKAHASVRIARREYVALKKFLTNEASRNSEAHLADLFRSLPYEPYAPVRRQLMALLRAVNRRRIASSLMRIPSSHIRLRRRPVTVFTTGTRAGTSSLQIPHDETGG